MVSQDAHERAEALRDYPTRIWVERDEETNEKRWFSVKGIGVEYVRVDSSSPSPEALPSHTSGAASEIEPLIERLRYRLRKASQNQVVVDEDDLADAILLLCEALAKPASEPAGGGVRVKPLEWRQINLNCFKADTSFGSVRAYTDGVWSAWWIIGDQHASSFDAAKAAAQADYEKRILSALSSPASSPAEAEALPAGVEAVLRDLVATLNVRGSLMTIDPDKLRAIVRKAEAALSSAPAQEER